METQTEPFRECLTKIPLMEIGAKFRGATGIGWVTVVPLLTPGSKGCGKWDGRISCYV